ncbi:UDP-N-acetylglucosamine 2-epimerase [Amylibacter sp.]|nr:UDP-N-acetylglucosamine 2-epimerase [Amylibacter sp.]
MRKICVVITARPSYSRVKTALQAIKDHPDLELQLVVMASALISRYGSAVDYIEKDGFTINSKIFSVLEGENLTSAAKTAGLGILELSTVFYNLKPDIVVTVADRFETISTAVTASFMNIPIAHIQGGEVTGNIDEKVRHAVTKLADYHFVASEGAAQRVIKMGESTDSVFNTGCPSIDLAVDLPAIDFNPYEKYGGVGNKPDLNKGYIVVMQHPVTNEQDESMMHIEETLHAIEILNEPVMWFWPNVDAGADGTSKGIRSFREKNGLPNVHFFKNMEPQDFLKLLKNSSCLIGNSSVGIRECAYLGVPVINIGTRQNMRERGNNVLDVDYNRNAIVNGVKSLKNLSSIPSSDIYGSGLAGKKMATLLSEVSLKFHKTITY